jgi:hypothetical protein
MWIYVLDKERQYSFITEVVPGLGKPRFYPYDHDFFHEYDF